MVPARLLRSTGSLLASTRSPTHSTVAASIAANCSIVASGTCSCDSKTVPSARLNAGRALW
eukprot:166720-Pyramimonas_sp.AAC.1